jgi:CRISPR system Cascade subunit CasA
MTKQTELQYSLLDEPIIRYRRAADGQTVHANWPQLFVALAGDQVRDYPALRPHQRHPWHAFLVQLAAIALHKAQRTTAFETSAQWRDALLALTPDDPDGAAWCLVAPPDRPAFMQAAVVNGDIKEWKSETFSADEIDMLVTSKNHDVKGSRARRAQPEDWLLALLSLQTQEGVLGAGNYGISRMNRGYASKPGVGVAVKGRTGKRWSRDIAALLQHRDKTVADRGLQGEGGLALVWLMPWDGASSLNFSALDPFYIEICRRLRLQSTDGVLHAIGTGSKVARIAAKQLNGLTGDAWTPVDVEAGKALTITGNGFSYKLVSELMFGGKYQPPAAQHFALAEKEKGLEFIAQGITRGQGKTEGYHERRVPISPKVRGLLASGQKDVLAQLAAQRIAAIREVREVLRLALVLLYANGESVNGSDGNKTKATKFSEPFESAEDPRFFNDLNEEAESAEPTAQRLQWLLGLVARAEGVLRAAFVAGPRNGAQRYRAQSAALTRFHGGLRSAKFSISELVNYYRQQQIIRQEKTLEHT